jgi:hypothetical protein
LLGILAGTNRKPTCQINIRRWGLELLQLRLWPQRVRPCLPMPEDTLARQQIWQQGKVIEFLWWLANMNVETIGRSTTRQGKSKIPETAHAVSKKFHHASVVRDCYSRACRSSLRLGTTHGGVNIIRIPVSTTFPWWDTQSSPTQAKEGLSGAPDKPAPTELILGHRGVDCI